MNTYYIESDYEYLPRLFSSLNEVLEENKNYYVNCSGKKAEEFSQCFEELLSITAKTLKLLLEVAAVSPLFDYDPNIKGNGYRSIVKVVEMCFRRLHMLGKYFQENRDRLLFRSDHYYKEIGSYLELSKGLYKFLEFAQLLVRWSSGNDLFPPEDCCDAKTMTEVHLHAMEKECFYGRRLGFHFNMALRSFLTSVCISMASFGDGYAKHDGSFTVAAASLLNGPKYLINPDLRAKKLISLTTLVDMEFCKEFWSLTERYGFQHFPLVVASALKTNIMFKILPEPLELVNKSGDTVTFQPPSSWKGFAPVNVHLMSHVLREGQDGIDGKTWSSPQAQPKADGLIIHIHGGGFVAQSSKSHEIYLRGWAKSTNVPILSINYALAPESPFPRALEECLFAYVWVLKNLDKLGTTGKHIALVGDSAGGNLSITMCLKAASYGVRLPDGIVTAYAPFNVQFRPSPSRLLCLLDPLLPVGILTQCLAAYTGADKVKNSKAPEKGYDKNSIGTNSSENPPDSSSNERGAEIQTCNHHENSSSSLNGYIVKQLPDLVQDSRSQLPIHHSSSEFDLVHVHDDIVDIGRSYSDGDLVKDSRPTDDQETHGNSFGLMTDDYLLSMAKNPYLSPLAASDEQLALLPPVDLVACSMDPLFDDSIEFAKRLRAVNNKVELYVVDDLPHGFLSFYMVCQEGREANELCIACINKILLGKRNLDESEASPVY